MIKIWIFLLSGNLVACFNLEGRLPLYKQGPPGSTFGFSVAMHRSSSRDQEFVEGNLLVIGGPTARKLPSQTNAVNPGGVFYCPVDTTPGSCARVQMDQGESTERKNKTNQWLGVTVASKGAGDYLVTCAHRYSERVGTGEEERERVCGKCFLLDASNPSEVREAPSDAPGAEFIASPCVGVNSYDKNTFAYTQAGVSLTVADGEYLMGGPGAYAWSGAMFGYRLPGPSLLDNGLPTFDRGDFQTLGCKADEFRTGSTKVKCDDIPLRRDSYIGFSVTASNTMISNSNETVYVAGAPRGNFTGAVILYTRAKPDTTKLVLKDVVKGHQMGSSFGFSVAVTDLNGDNQDDLIVGAPQYYENSDAGKYGGRVYIYIKSRIPKFSKIKPQVLRGFLGSFFGHSVAPLGDIDRDGYKDFAVGSPYEESGKVYIYRGSPTGIVKESQVLDGKNYVALRPQMKAFGISMSGNVDIDSNKYPDLLVGTLEDQAILFRSRPIISVYASFNVSKKVIDLEQTDCPLNRKSYSCFSLGYCFNYTSRDFQYAAALDVRYNVFLDSNHAVGNKNARVRFSSPNGLSTMTDVVKIRRSDYQQCLEKQTVYFRPSTLDRFSRINVYFDMSLVSDGNVVTPEPRGAPVMDLINDPILDADLPSSMTRSVRILKDCISDDVCQSDLQINGSVPPEIAIGRDSKIILRLEVSNTGEEAHQASLSVKLPSHVFYDSYNVSTSSGAKISCKSREQGNSTFLLCSLGNPYVAGSRDRIEVVLDVSSLSYDTKQVVFEVTGSTTSNNPKLDPLVLTSKVVIELYLTLSGYGKPQQVRYVEAPIIGESAINYTDRIGPLINHTFHIKNAGKQTANGIKLVVDYPFEINNGKWLLYLVSTQASKQVSVGGGRIAGVCTETYTNTLHYKLTSPAIRASRRNKRQTDEGKVSPLYKPERVATPYTTGTVQSTLRLNCEENNVRCSSISCDIESLPAGRSVSVYFQSRLWNATFLEEFRNIDLVHVGVFGKLVNKNDNVRIVGNQTSNMIDTTVDHAFFEEDAIPAFPWWYILIAFILVLIIYIIIIFLLKKCGFFKRKRYPVHNVPPEVIDRDDMIEENQ